MVDKLPAKSKTTFGEDLIDGLNLIAAHRRVEIELDQVWRKPLSRDFKETIRARAARDPEFRKELLSKG